MPPTAPPASTVAWNWTGALTRGIFRREPSTVEARQPMAVRVGNSPSERMCCSPSKFFSSNRIQLGKGKREGMWVGGYLSLPCPQPAQAPSDTTEWMQTWSQTPSPGQVKDEQALQQQGLRSDLRKNWLKSYCLYWGKLGDIKQNSMHNYSAILFPGIYPKDSLQKHEMTHSQGHSWQHCWQWQSGNSSNVHQ